jgi:WS/DGAT/MGAT family acyltransferase
MLQLTGTDATMLAQDRPNAPNLIGGVEIYDPSTTPGGVRFTDILRRFEERAHVSTMFTHRLRQVPLGLDFPYWVRDPDFDVEFHVRHIALPHPGDWRQFAILIARLSARPLDLGRPPWEAYVIEGLDGVEGIAPGSFAVFIKLHHAAVDGQAGNEIVTAIHDEYVPTPSVEAEDDTEPSTPRLLIRAGVHAMSRPGTALRIARGAAPSLRGLPDSLRRRSRAPQASFSATRFNHPITSHRVWDTRFFPLAAFKGVKNAVEGATVNDVGLALVGGALRDYLLQHGELPERTLTAMMPLSVRAATGASAGGGNQIVIHQVPLGTDIADPRERLTAVQRATTEAKSSGASATSLMELADLAPGALPGLAARVTMSVLNRTGYVMGPHTLVTNVPGPRTPLHLCGARLVRVSGVPPATNGMGLVHGIGSYLDDINIIFTACREQLPDPDVYAACIDRSMAELLSLT